MVMVLGGWVGEWYWHSPVTGWIATCHFWSLSDPATHVKMINDLSCIMHDCICIHVLCTCLESNFNHVETDFLLVDTSDVHIFQSIEFECLSNIRTNTEWTTFKEKSMVAVPVWWREGGGGGKRGSEWQAVPTKVHTFSLNFWRKFFDFQKKMVPIYTGTDHC